MPWSCTNLLNVHFSSEVSQHLLKGSAQHLVPIFTVSQIFLHDFDDLAPSSATMRLTFLVLRQSPQQHLTGGLSLSLVFTFMLPSELIVITWVIL